MIGIYRLKPWKDRMIRGVAAWLIALGISANQVTLVGLALGVAAALFLTMNLIYLGLLFMALSVFSDLLDGALARLSGVHSFTGKILDSLCDRIVEIGWVSALHFNGLLPWWGWLMPIASVGLFLARWMAFRQDLETSFVPITRFERIAAIIITIILPHHGLSRFVYLLVSGGTWVSVFMIFFVMLQRNAGSYKRHPSIFQ